MIKRIYRDIVRTLLIISISSLALGGGLLLLNIDLGTEFIEFGMWLLIATPLAPIIFVLGESLSRRDPLMLIVVLIVLGIIIANLAFYGFGSIPFLTLHPLPW